jgi:hypothetical protein
MQRAQASGARSESDASLHDTVVASAGMSWPQNEIVRGHPGSIAQLCRAPGGDLSGPQALDTASATSHAWRKVI